MKLPDLDNAPCYYFSFDAEGKLLYVNQTLCAALQYEQKEFRGEFIDLIFTIASRIFFVGRWR